VNWAWVNIVSAIGTLLAIVVALFQKQLSSLFFHPNFIVRIDLSAPDCVKTKINHYENGKLKFQEDSYYFRLWVENIGDIRAEKVQVFFVKLLKKHMDGKYKEEKQFLPMNFRWSNSPIGQVEIFTEGISPKMGKHCDIGHLIDPGSPRMRELRDILHINEEKVLMEFDLEVFPATFSNVISPGEYQLIIKIAAANARPKEVKLKLNFNGNWFDDEVEMYSKGIGIQIID